MVGYYSPFILLYPTQRYVLL